MRKNVNAFMSAFLCMVLLFMSGCGKKTPWQEQYDLGVRYLSEGNYEEAVIAFSAAIQIDPKKVETYVALADTYVDMGESEQAKEVLTQALEVAEDSEVLQDKIEEVEQVIELETETETEDTADEAAVLPDDGTTGGWEEPLTFESAKCVSLAGAEGYAVGLRSDGTVMAAGKNDAGQCDVDDWTYIVAVAAASDHAVGLRSDGTVVISGDQDDDCAGAIRDWTDITAISADREQIVGLRSDGTVVAVGAGEDVTDWTDIISVAAGAEHTVGLRSDGTVLAVGRNDEGQCDVSEWTDVVAVDAGQYHTVGLRSDGTAVATSIGDSDYDLLQSDVGDWTDIVAASADSVHTVGLRSDGTVVAAGSDDYGQCDVEEWTDIVGIAACENYTLGLKNDGTVVAAGYDEDGQCDVSNWAEIMLPPERDADDEAESTYAWESTDASEETSAENVSDANEHARLLSAYEAYLDLLTEKRDDIDSPNWTYSWQPGDPVPQPEAVALTDITDDDIPEVIYMQPDENTLVTLHIATFRDGELTWLYEDENTYWGGQVGGGFSHCLFKIEGDTALYSYLYPTFEAEGHIGYSRFTLTEDGTLERVPVCDRHIVVDHMNGLEIETYLVDGAESTEDGYLEKEEEILSDITQVFQSSFATFGEAEHAEEAGLLSESYAMTCEEAIAYLQTLIGNEASQDGTVEDETTQDETAEEEAPQEEAPQEDEAPEDVAPASLLPGTAEDEAPQEEAPQPETPEEEAPEPEAPEEVPQEDKAPEDVAPASLLPGTAEGEAAQEEAPQTEAPEEAAQDETPEDAAATAMLSGETAEDEPTQDEAPQEEAPEEETPEDADAEDVALAAMLSGRTEVDVATLPESLSAFLKNFTDWYWDATGSWDSPYDKSYDCEHAADGRSNIMAGIVNHVTPSIVDFSLYPGVMPRETMLADEWYMDYDGPTVDWVAKNIFNVSDGDLDELVRQAGENGIFVLDGMDDGYLYTVSIIGGIGDPMTEVRLTSAEVDGQRYFVTYDVYFVGSPEAYPPIEEEFLGSYSAELELKNIDGEDYWSLYSNSPETLPEAPESVPETETEADVADQQEDAGTETEVEVAAVDQPTEEEPTEEEPTEEEQTEEESAEEESVEEEPAEEESGISLDDWLGKWYADTGESLDIRSVSDAGLSLVFNIIVENGDVMASPYEMEFDDASKAVASEVGDIAAIAGWEYTLVLNDGSITVQSRYPDQTFVKDDDKDTLVLTGDQVNIRTGPSTDYTALGMAAQGARLVATGKSDNWYQINYNGAQAYIIEDYVTPDTGMFSWNDADDVLTGTETPSQAEESASEPDADVEANVTDQPAEEETETVPEEDETETETDADAEVEAATADQSAEEETEEEESGISLDDWLGKWYADTGESLDIRSVSDTGISLVFNIIVENGDVIASPYEMEFDDASKTIASEMGDIAAIAGWEYTFVLNDGSITVQSRYPDQTFVKDDDKDTLVLTGDQVNIRTGPSTDYTALGMAAQGARLVATGKSDNWYQINYNGAPAYIIEDYVTPDTGMFFWNDTGDASAGSETLPQVEEPTPEESAPEPEEWTEADKATQMEEWTEEDTAAEPAEEETVQENENWVDLSALPGSLSSFLNRFIDWYWDSSYSGYYDCEHAADGDSNILASIANDEETIVDFSLYPGVMPEELQDTKAYDGPTTDWIAKHIFNVSEGDLADLAWQAEQQGDFYREDTDSGYRYIAPFYGVGDMGTEVRLTSAEFDGQKYYVTYDVYNVMFTASGAEEYDSSYYAELEYKNIDGENYWSLYLNTPA